MSYVNFIFVSTLFIAGAAFTLRGLAGWVIYREKFPCERKLPPHCISNGSYRWVSASMGFTPITLAIEIYPEALWLRASFPLSLFGPLCIPWHAIESVALTSNLIGKRALIKLAGIDLPIRISGAAGERIHEAFQVRIE